VAVVLPAKTVTLAGTWAAAVLLLVRLTTAPPVGAGLSSVTVPVEGFPPSTEVGFRLMELSLAGVTVIVTVAVFDATPLEIARYVKLSIPLNPALGEYSNEPSAWRLTVPCDVGVTSRAVRSGPPRELSFPNTPGAAIVNVPFSCTV
jgi:hypothetical protein